ncbi:uncharacterized protein F5Z01DRAFT_675812 [Emericellopsis atlantica]|uniref:Arrestin-like N-terminal domain-containing protein n=1 Tax=Emericellopsis atlantica TaxID=2614577 RepID=A0A9P7ZIT3_9HYPO|nr:uncharacterized protein F5Z01DRAFT_675812 [Emericellopsis atlantica]KAG9252701.1 hypothetical protein F5Z01DRAFT_675812 [Emericellopsis atlantica]
METDKHRWTTSSDQGPVHLDLAFTVESGFRSGLYSSSVCLVRPGDTLKGSYRIKTGLAMGGSWVEVSLQGIQSVMTEDAVPSRDGMYRDHFRAERFLHLSHRVKLDDDHKVEDGQRVYTVPFVLVIPPGLDRTSDRTEDRCKPLPPSFDIQRSALTAWSRPVPPSVFISYLLRASVQYSGPPEDAAPGRPKSAHVVHPLTCLPYLETQPPIETSCFPKEYVLSARQTVWGSFVGRKLGHVTFETREPPPLVYNSEQASATDCILWITIDGRPADLHRLRAASIKVEPVLQIRTYYSGTKLAGTPHREAVNESRSIRLHADTWSTRDARRASTTSVASFWPSGESVREEASRPTLAAEEDTIPWHTHATVPIEPPLRLQPSFCGDYVASSYAIIAKISIGGVYAKSSYLFFPLQVAYPCAARRDSEQTGVERLGPAPSPSLENNVCCSAMDADMQSNNDLMPPPYVAQ